MADRVGQRLDNYRLIRLLGAGGFGEVYLAEHVYRGTQVAIKVLPQLAGDDLPGFLNEARTFRLRDPHIVQILDFGVADRVPFIVMEYAPNGNLRQRHPRGTQVPPHLVVSYVRQVAAALQYAHIEKLIHRDVKPENMLLGANNEVLLSDFGIATIAHSTRSQSAQEMAGTVAYMAPEQIQGRPVLASDQYALGVVVYEWLCGERPFQGSPMEIVTQHMVAPVPSLHERIPGIPSDVDQVVMKALEKDPNKRFLSVQAFANALEKAAQAGLPSVIDQPVQRDQALPLQPTVVALSASPQEQSTFMAPPQSPVLPTSGGVTPPLQLPPSAVGTTWSSALQQPRRGISRRAIVLGLAGLVTVAVVGGGVFWLTHPQNSPSTSFGSTPPPGSLTSAPPVDTATTAATPGFTSISSAGLKTPGLLQWGADYVSGAPYVFQNPATSAKELIGFEVEIAQTMADLMRINQAQIEVCYANLEQALLANQIDMVMNGWEQTPNRLQTELFSEPYYRYGQQVIVRQNDTRFANLVPQSVADLAGYTVGTGSGYKAEAIMMDYNATNPAKKITIQSYSGNILFSDLVQGKLDTFFLDEPIAAYYVLGTGPGASPIPQLKLLGDPINFDNYYVGFNKSNPNATILLPEVNQCFAILKSNGTLKRIYTKWQIMNSAQATIGVM